MVTMGPPELNTGYRIPADGARRIYIYTNTRMHTFPRKGQPHNREYRQMVPTGQRAPWSAAMK